MEALNPLKKTLEAMNIENSQELIEKFRIYMEGVLEWNEKVNLTTITDPDEFVIKHFIDSIICANYPEYVNAAKIIDVGTGAGFPGIPLSIISPEKEFILMDSLNKRLKIIDELCQRSDIKNVVTLHARAEELAKNGISDRTLRLSVGIESIGDLISEFERIFRLGEEERNE